MKNFLRVLLGAFVALALTSMAWAEGSWDSYSPQSVPQGNGFSMNGWGYVNGLTDIKANIYIDGNFTTQVSMTEWRPDIHGGGYWGWRTTIDTSSLSIGTHNVSVWVGSNSAGQWLYFSQSYVEHTGTLTVTQPILPQSVRFMGIPTKSPTQTVQLRSNGLDQPYYRATYSDLNNAFGDNVGAYWDHWYYRGFGEWRECYYGSLWEASAYSQSGLPVTISVLSGPAYISGSTLYFNGVGTVTLRAYQGGGTVSSTGRIFASAYTDISFNVVNNAPTVAWNPAPPTTFYRNDWLTPRATGNDADGNLTNVSVQYQKNNSGTWVDFAVNGGGNGYTNTTDNNGLAADMPGTTYKWQMKAGDALGATTGWLPNPMVVYTVTNRSPYNLAFSVATGGATGVTYNPTGMCYEMWVGSSLTMTTSVSDWDGDLARHYINRIISPMGNTSVLINDGTNGNPTDIPSNGSNSTKVVTYAPPYPGRYDFHTDAYDSLGSYAEGPGLSITVYVYGPTNNADFVSQTIAGVANPTSVNVTPGQVFSAAITMRNNGDKPWTTDGTPHRLGAVNDSMTFGLNRVALPVSPVNPLPQTNSDAAFSFNVTAPSAPGPYTFQWRMLEESIVWFGTTTPAVTVNVNAAPTITAQPQNVTTNAGTTAQFSVSNTAWPAPTYQWRKNGTNIAGATSATLTLTNVQTSDAATYSVVITNSLGSATSNNASLTVNTLPSFTTQPTNQAVNAGSTATFTASATGIPAPTYQWKKNGNTIAGATSATLTLSNVQPSDAATYTVVATNSVGSTTSNGATLTVYTAPVITAQPQNQTVALGGTASFTVTATGNPAPTYQWRKNGTNISGATSATLTISNAQTTDAATYSVVATNLVSSTTSGNATLTVVTQPPGAPVALTGTSVTTSSFVANWTLQPDAASYRIDVSTNNFASFVGSYNNLDVGNVSSVTVTGLSAGASYQYRIRAVNVVGASANSNVVALPTAATGGDGGSLPAGWPNQAGSATTAVGLTTGSLSVDKSGALTYSVPIWISPGTAGMQPQVALNYSSQAGSGIAGYGWSVGGVSAISRGPQTRATDGQIRPANFTSNDRYYLDGQRLIAISGADGAVNTEYRTENDSFTKVISYGSAGLNGPAYFKAWTKAGLIIEFGNTSDSRVDAEPRYGESTSRGGISWSVSKISDTAGNYMTFTYTWDATNREQTLARIDYTGNANNGTLPYAKIEFVYETRPDSRRAYVLGSRVGATQRLQQIKSSSPSGVAKVYTLAYTQQPVSNWSVLGSITESDGGTGNGHAYDPLTFTYSQHDAASMNWSSFSSGFNPPQPLSSSGSAGTGYVDLDGDGYPDFAAYRKWSGGSLAYQGIWFNRSSGFVAEASNSSWQLPLLLGRDGNPDQGSRFIDVNGDGKVDFLNGGTYNPDRNVWLNTGSGWAISSAYHLPDYFVDTGVTTGAVIDVNGDGLPDLVVSRSGKTGAYLNTGSGWSAFQSNWYLPQPSDGSLQSSYIVDGGKDNGIRFVDLNGDGLPDALQGRMKADGTWLAGRAWLNTGSGWVYESRYIPHQPLVRDDYPAWGVELTDINGDGLVDMVCNHYDGTVTKETWLNTGDGWTRDTTVYDAPFQLAIGNNVGSSTKSKAGAALIDLTQDGFPTELWSRYTSLGIQQGIAFANGTGFISAPTTGLSSIPCYLGWDGQPPVAAQFVDLDADGAADLVWNVQDAPAGYSPTVGAQRNTTPRANLLTKVTNGFGVAATITYAPLTERSGSSYTVYDKGTGGPTGSINVISPMYVVKTVTNDDGAGGQYPVNYRYGDLRTHPTYGSLGFGWMRSTDGRTGIYSTTWFKQDFPYIGMPYLAETKKSDGTSLSKMTTTYAVLSLNSGKTRLPYAQDVVQLSYELDGSFISGTDTTTTLDSYGNATNVTVNSLTSALAPDGFSKTTVSTFTNDTVNWFLGRLSSSTVTSAAPGKTSITRTSSFSYSSTTGLLTQEVVEPNNSALKLTTTYGYDAFGNKTSVSVADSGGTTRTTTTSYTTNGRFPASSTNAANQTETYAYHATWGGITSLTGPNNLTTTWTYDNFGNKTQENRADSTSTVILTKWAGSGAPSGAKYFTETTTTGGAPSLAFFDVMGRKIRVVGLDGAGAMILQDTSYDSMGRAYRTSVPYRSGGTQYWTQTTSYDVLNRPLTVQTPRDESGAADTTTFAYKGLTTEVTDVKGRLARTVKNSQGWVTSSIRDVNGTAATVTYDYDAIGNLTSTNAAGVTTTMTYDNRGRKTQMVDPDMGTWTYGYNAFGELTSQTDAKSQSVTMGYDALGRMTSRVEAEGTTIWTYDTAANGKGKLASVAAPGSYGETYTYDSLGRPNTVSRTIDGVAYSIGQTYDGSGRPEKTVYPTGFQTKNVYNAFGFVKEVRRADGTTNELFWRADSYAVDGRINGETYGNGVTNDRIYDKASGRLTGAGVGLGTGTEVQFLAYTYDQIGNVTARSDGAIGRSETFVYDTLDRLTSHALAGGATVTVTYDAKGNITNKSDVGNYTYDATKQHAVTQAGSNTYTYDNNGNMAAGAGRSITWTSFNQVKSITQGSFNTTFYFGAAHERIKQVAHNGTTLYVGGVWEKFTNSGGTTEEKNYILAPTGRIAVMTYGTAVSVYGKINYFHTDGLASITSVTDAGSAVVKRFAYDAWGKRINPSTGAVITSGTNGSVTRGFTDHEQMDDFGLIHMNGRVYDPVLGRFLSADPNVDGVYDSQGFNRYSYVQNNPLNRTDPSGYFSLKDAVKIVAVIVVAVVVTIATYGAATGQMGALMGYAFGSVGAASSVATSIGACAAAGNFAALAAVAAGGFASGFAGSLLNGGSVGDAFRSGLVGAAVGVFTAGIAGVNFDNDLGQFAWKVSAHGAVGGAAAEANGGDFRHGFLGSAVAAGVDYSGARRVLPGDKYVATRTARAAVVGGTVSALGGGKFANGAVTAAFQHLFNQETQRRTGKVMFLRLSEFDEKQFGGKVDANSNRWGEIVNDYADKLLKNGDIEDRSDLIFRVARSEDEAYKYLRQAMLGGYDIILSSHGHPIDPDNDLKGYFGKNPASAAAFMGRMNTRLGSDLLSRATPWYSCDHDNGAMTPAQIWEDRARAKVDSFLFK
jgi:RHS repeat-associated protein